MTSHKRPGTTPLVAALAVALMLAACAGGEEKPTVAGPPPGTATLYVLNSGKPIFQIGANTVFDYRQKLVTVSEARYAIVYLPQGRHVLSCAGMPATAPAVLDVTPGQTYYLNTYRGSGNTEQICTLLPPGMGAQALARIKKGR